MQNPIDESHMNLFSNHSNSKFERFIKQTVKIDLFNLTYENDIFSQLLKEFIPRSDAFVKPIVVNTPTAASQSRGDRS